MQRPIVYIAGPMSDIDNYNKENFNKIAEIATNMGWIVLNPATLPLDMPSKNYMPICLAMLEQSDCMYLLPGSRDSKYKGVGAEIAYARVQHITILEDLEMLQQAYHSFVGDDEEQLSCL